MGQFFFWHASQGKDLNNASGGPIKIYGAGHVTPRFEQRFQVSTIFSIVGSGETDFNFSQPLPDLNHPTHGVEIFLVKVQRNGPASAATLTFRFTLRLNGGQVNSNDQVISFPAQGSGTDFVAMAAVGWHWVSGEITQQSSGYSNKCELLVNGSPIGVTIERFFSTTSVPSISSFLRGINSPGAMWIQVDDESIHYVDDLQIEHTIPSSGGSLSVPGAVDGQIYIDSLLPRIGYTVNERRFLTRAAIREIAVRQVSGKTPGYIHVTNLSNDRRYWIQMIGADGKNYILSDGRDT